VFDRGERSVEVPQLALGLHHGQGGDAFLLASLPQPARDLGRLEGLLCCEPAGPGDDIFHCAGAVGTGAHGAAHRPVVGRDRACGLEQGLGLGAQSVSGGGVAATLGLLGQREPLRRGGAQSELGAAKLEALDAIAEQGENEQDAAEGE
jgi:hypothetical protein